MLTWVSTLLLTVLAAGYSLISRLAPAPIMRIIRGVWSSLVDSPKKTNELRRVMKEATDFTTWAAAAEKLDSYDSPFPYPPPYPYPFLQGKD